MLEVLAEPNWCEGTQAGNCRAAFPSVFTMVMHQLQRADRALQLWGRRQQNVQGCVRGLCERMLGRSSAVWLLQRMALPNRAGLNDKLNSW